MATGTKDKPTLADAVYKTDEQERKDAEEPIAPVRLWQRISKKPWVAHLMRMMERFGQRLGSQFAAAITYFSFFSLVPMLMVSFAITGIVLSSQPELIQKVKDEVGSVLSSAGGQTSDALNGVIDNAVEARWSIGIVALVLALYTAIGWMTNLRMAVRAQWRQDFEEDEDDKETFFVALGKDLLALVVLGLGILLSVVLTTVGTGLTGFVAELFGVDDVGWITAVLSIVPIALAIGVSTMIFYFLYRFLPRHSEEIPRRKIWRGAIAAAVIYEILKLALSLLIQQFSSSPTAAVFGSVIALLAFINLVARMILMVAAWIGTSIVKEEGPARDEKAVVIRPVYRVRSMPAVAGGLGLGAAMGWIARKVRRG
jgi:membrane protein